MGCCRGSSSIAASGGLGWAVRIGRRSGDGKGHPVRGPCCRCLAWLHEPALRMSAQQIARPCFPQYKLGDRVLDVRQSGVQRLVAAFRRHGRGRWGPPRTDECSADVQRSCTFTGEPNCVHRFAIRAGKAGRPHGTGRARHVTNRRFRAPHPSALRRCSAGRDERLRAVEDRRGGPACRGRMARVRGNVDRDGQPPHDSPRQRSARLDRRSGGDAAARRALAPGPGLPRRGDRAQRQRDRHGRPCRLDRRARRPGVQRAARRRHGNGQPDRRDLPRRNGALCRRHGQLRILLAVRARVRGRKRAGPIGRPEGSGAGGTPPAAPGAGGPRP